MTDRYLSLSGFAQRAGVTYQSAKTYLRDGRIPDPDVAIGAGDRWVYGWLPETVDAWQASRPGQGARTDLRRKVK